jgi:hypothetical protein
MILDDTKPYKMMEERPPEHTTSHNGGHDDDEYNNRHNDGSNRLSQGISSTSMTSTAERHQRLASISILPV